MTEFKTIEKNRFRWTRKVARIMSAFTSLTRTAILPAEKKYKVWKAYCKTNG